MANYGDTVEDNSGSFDFYHLLVVRSSNSIKERRRTRILGFFNPHSKPTSEGVYLDDFQPLEIVLISLPVN